MTDVRLVRRTHYQVLEPALLRWLVGRGTSAVSSDFPDRVARKLSDVRKDLNVAAARYVVDLGKALNLVNGNLVWTDLGHLLSVVGSYNRAMADGLELSDAERVVFFRIFLEFDGAAVIFFAKKIEAQQTVPSPRETWGQVAQELFETTYGEYLRFVADPQLRVHVRQLAEKRHRHPFRGKSGAHQSWVHIHTLHRLGFLEKMGKKSGRVYKAKDPVQGTPRPTAKLLELIPNLEALEKVVTSQSCYEVAKHVVGHRPGDQDMSDVDFVQRVRAVYDDVMATGVALCPIQTLSEAIQVQSVTQHLKVPRAEVILTRLRKMQERAPYEIRFHVDRSGYPAFVKMS